MARTSSKKVLSTPQPVSAATFGDVASFILLFILDVLVIFSARISLNFFRWLVMVIVRGYIFYQFAIHSEQFFSFFAASNGETVTGVLHDVFLILPVMLFTIWYIITTVIMFLGALYGSFGYRTVGEDGEFYEIDRFIQWRDNKMKFMSYKDSTQLMRDTAIINNLDRRDPEASKVLDYINNKFRFTSYPGALKFLRGEK